MFDANTLKKYNRLGAGKLVTGFIQLRAQRDSYEKRIKELEKQVSDFNVTKANTVIEAVKNARNHWVREDLKSIRNHERAVGKKAFEAGVDWSYERVKAGISQDHKPLAALNYVNQNYPKLEKK